MKNREHRPQALFKYLIFKLKHSPLLHHSCLLCATSSPERICSPCQDYLLKPQYQCQRCGIDLKVHAIICGDCLKRPPAFDETIAPFIYQAPLDTLIKDFKHKGKHTSGKALSTLFCREIQDYYQGHHASLPEYLLPVPLHWRRQWQRGFNQAEVLAEALLKQLNSNHPQIKLFGYAKKQRANPAQEGLSKKQRLTNLKDSFVITKALSGQSIAIIDDVMTTGATANSLAQALKKAGAGKVSVWALARTPKSRTSHK